VPKKVPMPTPYGFVSQNGNGAVQSNGRLTPKKERDSQ
jgi:hypothetical protein